MLSHLHRASELIFSFVHKLSQEPYHDSNWENVAEREALYPSRTFIDNDDDNNDNLVIHTI